jgi:branched-chain amino acid aminotransferase
MPFNVDQRDGFIWFNGHFVEWRKAVIHVMTHGLHYGSSVFEGERCYNGSVFRMRDHSDRLLRSAKIMDIDIDYESCDIDEIVTDTLKKNELKNAYVRPLAWKGSEDMGVLSTGISSNLMVAAWTWEPYNKAVLTNGISLCMADWVKPDPRSAPVEAKSSGLYMINSISKNKARRKGFDDALMLDYRGYVAESTGSNIFFVIDGEVHTPIPHSFLNGITRQTIIKISRELGYIVRERNILPDELKGVGEVFLTGTAAEVLPVSRIENQMFEIGNVTRTLVASYADLVNSYI